MEVIEIRAPLPAESAHPDVRHGTPSWSLLLFVCEAGTDPLPLWEYVTLASAVTYAHASLVVEYVTPARTVACAAPVTTRTAAPTVFPTATVPISKLRQVRTGQTAQQTAEILQLRLLDQVVSMPVVAVQTVQPVEIPQVAVLRTRMTCPLWRWTGVLVRTCRKL